MAEVLARILVCDRVKVIDPQSPYFGQSGEVVGRSYIGVPILSVRFDDAVHGRKELPVSALEKEEA